MIQPDRHGTPLTRLPAWKGFRHAGQKIKYVTISHSPAFTAMEVADAN
jgi:hypothetical protein